MYHSHLYSKHAHVPLMTGADSLDDPSTSLLAHLWLSNADLHQIIEISWWHRKGVCAAIITCGSSWWSTTYLLPRSHGLCSVGCAQVRQRHKALCCTLHRQCLEATAHMFTFTLSCTADITTQWRCGITTPKSLGIVIIALCSASKNRLLCLRHSLGYIFRLGEHKTISLK